MNPSATSTVRELSAIIDQISSRTDVRGVIVTSGKSVFAAGWDLKDLLGLLDEHPPEAAGISEQGGEFSQVLGRLETCGKPVAAAINGLALGVSLELQYKVIRQAQEDLGDSFVPPVSWRVLRHFVEDLKRLGRKSGGGFYEYPSGARKHLWPGVRSEYPPTAVQPTVEELQKRLLYIQALETARCLEEGVLASVAEADLGSVLGWGFPAYTGGTLSFIDTVGVARFVDDCQRLARELGPRFEPTPGLRVRAADGKRFHPNAPRAAA